MSLTQTERVFGSVHETAINDFLSAFFTARPRYLHYSSSTSLLPPGTPFIAVPSIAFPGVPTGGIDYAVSFELPTVDINPDSSGGASPLPPGAQQFTVKTKVTLTVGCFQRRGLGRRENNFVLTPITAELDVFGRGGLVLAGIGTGAGTVGFVVQEVELVDVTPDPLESVLECLIRTMLQGALSNLQIPIETLLLGAIPFPMTLVRGPLAEVDAASVFANL